MDTNGSIGLLRENPVCFDQVRALSLQNKKDCEINDSLTTTNKAVPKCLVMNARSLVKPDAPSALNTELRSNNIDVCFVSETWLNSNISSNQKV